METLDNLKKKWNEGSSAPASATYDRESLEKIFRSRSKKQINTAMQYFWASFTLQVIVYSMLTHTLVKFFHDQQAVLLSVVGIALFIPFTIVLMDKFKRIARNDAPVSSGAALHAQLLGQRTLLLGFYTFKKRYEMVLIPLASAIGVVLVFRLFVPGEIMEHVAGVVITFLLTLLSCALAIRAENKKNFREPLRNLEQIVEEFRQS
jgi:hypothetical protein